MSFFARNNDWFKNRKLGLLFEVDGGKLFVCSADLHTDINKRLAARQFKYSLIHYMNSDTFNPKCKMEISKIQ